MEDVKRHLDYVNDSGLKSTRDTEMEKMYYYIIELKQQLEATEKACIEWKKKYEEANKR